MNLFLTQWVSGKGKVLILISVIPPIWLLKSSLREHIEQRPTARVRAVDRWSGSNCWSQFTSNIYPGIYKKFWQMRLSLDFHLLLTYSTFYLCHIKYHNSSSCMPIPIKILLKAPMPAEAHHNQLHNHRIPLSFPVNMMCLLVKGLKVLMLNNCSHFVIQISYFCEYHCTK